MIPRSAAIAAAALLVSLLLHLLGLGWGAPERLEPAVEDRAGDAVAMGNAFEDVAEDLSEPVPPEPAPVPETPPEPDLAEATTSEALVASPSPEQVLAPRGTPGEPSEPVAPQEAPEAATTPVPQPDIPEQLAALPPEPAEPVAPAESNTPPAPETPEQASEPEEAVELTPQDEGEQTPLAVATSPRPRLPEREPPSQQTPRDDNVDEFSNLRSPPLIESPLAAHLRGETQLNVQSSGGSGFLDSGGSGNASETNYAGRVLVHLNRSLTVKVTGHGAAWVFFEINPDGSLASVGIIDSNGTQELRDAAVAQVRNAAPFPRPPNGKSRQLTFIYRNR